MDDQGDELRDIEKLHDLIELYRAEAQRCRNAKAYLAGCVMVGAALEGALLAMAQCYPEEVQAWARKRPGRKLRRDFRRWNLVDLLAVSKHLGWLPAVRRPHDESDADKPLIGDYAEVVREIRDLVHAGRYVREYSEEVISQEHLELSFDVLDAASDWLYAKLEASLREEMLKEGRDD